MPGSAQTRITIGYTLAVLLGALFQDVGGTLSYSIIGLTCAWLNVHAFRKDDALTPTPILAVAVVAFVVARLAESVAVSISDLLYAVGYLVSAAALVAFARIRVQRLQIESFLEAAVVSATAFLIVTQGAGVLGIRIDVSVYTLATPILVFLVGLAFVGRDSRGPAVLWWSAAAAATLLAEVPHTIVSEQAVFEFGRIHLSSLPFLPLALAVASEDAIVQTRPSEFARRRVVGPLQLLATAAILVFPVILLARLASGEGLRNVGPIFATSVGIIAAVVVRFWLLIKARDRANRSDKILSALGEHLVIVNDPSEAASLVAQAAVDLAKGFAAEAEVVELLDDEYLLLGLDTKSDQARTLPHLIKLGNPEADDNPEHDDNTENPEVAPILPEGVISSSSGPYSILVRTTKQPPIELREELRNLNSMLHLVLDSRDAREKDHKKRSNSRFSALVQDSGDIILVVNPETMLIEFASPTLNRIIGLNPADVIGRPPLHLLVEADAKEVAEELQASSSSNFEVVPRDVGVIHQDGHTHWFSLTVRDLRQDKDVAGLVYNLTDINDRKLAELQLSTSELQYRTMVQNASDVIAVVDADNSISYVTPNIQRMLGYRPADLIGSDVRGVLTDRGRAQLKVQTDRHDLSYSDYSFDVEVRSLKGDKFTAEVTLADAAELDGQVLITMRDVTENRRLEKALKNQAMHDELTGLLNRTALRAELEQLLQRMKPGQYLGVVHLDIDDFHPINESVGFETGDKLLVDVASRLRTQLRAGDALARPSSDEFVVLAVHETQAAAHKFAERLGSVFHEKFAVGDHLRKIDAAFGVVTSDDLLSETRRLLEAAAIAMKVAKSEPGSFVVFEESMRDQVDEQYEIAAAIAPAIRDESFTLAYQPVLGLDSRHVRSVEALLRWQHPLLGNVSPGVFIPIAERSGEIVELGRWVMRRACSQVAQWHRELDGGASLGIAVNVSARQLEAPGEAAALRDIIIESGIDPRSLTVELTESVMIEDAASLRADLEIFRNVGVKIAVDDFGSGVADLKHLKKVPFDVLKMDKTFVDHVESDSEVQNLVSGVIELAHAVGAKVVAEGIETPGQALVLSRLRCDYGQGFYLGRPMAATKLEDWFAKGWKGEVPALIDQKPGW